MNQQRKCFVCGATGLLSDGPLSADDAHLELTPLVAQCPRCQRYYCSRHAEPLKVHLPNASWLRRLLGRRRTWLCCPFDPGAPLGVAHDA